MMSFLTHKHAIASSSFEQAQSSTHAQLTETRLCGTSRSRFSCFAADAAWMSVPDNQGDGDDKMGVGDGRGGGKGAGGEVKGSHGGVGGVGKGNKGGGGAETN